MVFSLLRLSPPSSTAQPCAQPRVPEGESVLIHRYVNYFFISFPHQLNGSPAAPGDQPKRVLNRLSDIDIFNGMNEWWRS